MHFFRSDEFGSWSEDLFQKTMVMPTYLLAFIVCDYSYLSTVTASGVEVCFSVYVCVCVCVCVCLSLCVFLVYVCVCLCVCV